MIVPTPPESNPKGARAIRIGAIRELERQASLRPALGGRRVFVLDEAERMTGEAPPGLPQVPGGAAAGHRGDSRAVRRARGAGHGASRAARSCASGARDGGRAAAAVGEALALLQAARAEGAPALFRRTDRLDRETAEALIDGCWLLCRDLLLARAGAPRGAAERRRPAPRRWPRRPTHWTDDGLLAAIEACRHARETLINNVTPRLTVETVVSRLLARAA